MGLKSCEVFFDNPWNTYYAGQTVNGRVDFEFDSPKKIRGKFENSVKKSKFLFSDYLGALGRSPSRVRSPYGAFVSYAGYASKKGHCLFYY